MNFSKLLGAVYNRSGFFMLKKSHIASMEAISFFALF